MKVGLGLFDEQQRQFLAIELASNVWVEALIARHSGPCR